MRPLPEGTVARGHLNDDELMFTGKVNGQFADEFPFPVTRDVLERGHERFNIYCSPCHGRTAMGNGMIVQRGLRPPPSFHDDKIRTQPVGYYFDVMTNGFGAMQDYRAQVDAEGSLGDRRPTSARCSTASGPAWPTCRRTSAASWTRPATERPGHRRTARPESTEAMTASDLRRAVWRGRPAAPRG